MIAPTAPLDNDGQVTLRVPVRNAASEASCIRSLAGQTYHARLGPALPAASIDS